MKAVEGGQASAEAAQPVARRKKPLDTDAARLQAPLRTIIDRLLPDVREKFSKLVEKVETPRQADALYLRLAEQRYGGDLTMTPAPETAQRLVDAEKAVKAFAALTDFKAGDERAKPVRAALKALIEAAVPPSQGKRLSN